MIKTFDDHSASWETIFQRKVDERKKKKGEREGGKEGERKADTPPRGALTRKIPAVVEQFYLQWLNEILKNVSGELVNRTAESIVF